MMAPFAKLLISLVVALPLANGFTFASPRGLTKTRLSMTSYEVMMELEKIKDVLGANKEYQLEEREDRDSEMTVVWLNRDGSVTLGETDGPLYHAYTGHWWLVDPAETDKPFRLRLDRTYDSGVVHTGENQAGEITYHVKREFWGTIGQIGDTVSIEGVMHGLDEAANIDCELGYFALIDEASETMLGPEDKNLLSP